MLYLTVGITMKNPSLLIHLSQSIECRCDQWRKFHCSWNFNWLMTNSSLKFLNLKWIVVIIATSVTCWWFHRSFLQFSLRIFLFTNVCRNLSSAKSSLVDFPSRNPWGMPHTFKNLWEACHGSPSGVVNKRTNFEGICSSCVRKASCISWYTRLRVYWRNQGQSQKIFGKNFWDSL